MKIAMDCRHLESRELRYNSRVSRATPHRRHFDDVSASYCDCSDVISSGGDVIRDVVLPTAFVRRRNERERQRVRYTRCFSR